MAAGSSRPSFRFVCVCVGHFGCCRLDVIVLMGALLDCYALWTVGRAGGRVYLSIYYYYSMVVVRFVLSVLASAVCVCVCLAERSKTTAIIIA